MRRTRCLPPTTTRRAELIGQYAKAAAAGKKPVIATLDLFPGHPVGAQRHNGFLKGFGLQANDAKSNELSRPPKWSAWPTALATAPRARPAWKTACRRTRHQHRPHHQQACRRRCLQRAQGRRQQKNVLIVSVDGGCAGIADVGRGVIAATSQQYPLRMAAMGVAAGVEYAKTGKKVSGYTDTGVTLIAAKPMAGVDSKDVKTGTDLCWGAK